VNSNKSLNLMNLEFVAELGSCPPLKETVPELRNCLALSRTLLQCSGPPTWRGLAVWS
jgi:hypothetical protein